VRDANMFAVRTAMRHTNVCAVRTHVRLANLNVSCTPSERVLARASSAM
jgi:hypothetical protein